MKTSAIFALAFLCIEASAYQNLSQADAQQAANGLWGKIRGPGGCLFSSNLPSSAPSQNLAALWLRAIFHDAGTFNANASNGAGGLDGSLALSAEYNLPVNGGINASLANRFLPPGSKLTNSDAIALGGIVTVATCGGPQVGFQTGRQDASLADIVANLPSNATAPVSEIAAGFARMGLNKLDMLVLTTGSHSLGGAHAAISPSLTSAPFAPFDSTPGVFDNDIFKKVLLGRCVVPLDCAFAQDPTLLPYIQQFATSQNAFFAQYAISFEKMLALTKSVLSMPVAINITIHDNLVQEGTFPAPTNVAQGSPIAQAGTPQANGQTGIPQPILPAASSPLPVSGPRPSGALLSNPQTGIPQANLPAAGAPVSGARLSIPLPTSPQTGIPQPIPQAAGVAVSGPRPSGSPASNPQAGVPQPNLPVAAAPPPVTGSRLPSTPPPFTPPTPQNVPLPGSAASRR
ncbi:L-ascorbate peroxidase 3 [Podochytrium sp. JEL0797]|nr:L-ascorbate peroxidase 3 [Podochytrium sp. JEL0797]